jgi:hypothetical protein
MSRLRVVSVFGLQAAFDAMHQADVKLGDGIG